MTCQVAVSSEGWFRLPELRYADSIFCSLLLSLLGYHCSSVFETSPGMDSHQSINNKQLLRGFLLFLESRHAGLNH